MGKTGPRRRKSPREARVQRTNYKQPLKAMNSDVLKLRREVPGPWFPTHLLVWPSPLWARSEEAPAAAVKKKDRKIATGSKTAALKG